MPCLITAGRNIDCKNQLGGIRKVYIQNYVDIPAQTGFTATGNTISIVTSGADLSVYEYRLRPELSNFDISISTDINNGTYYYSQKLTIVLQTPDATDIAEVQNLTYGRPNIWVLDNDDQLYLLGARNGMDVTSGSFASGTAMNDMKGITLEFTGRERQMCYFGAAGTAANPFSAVDGIAVVAPV
jgi:hypothetical protein